MAWTYSDYRAANYCISLGLCVVTGFVVLIIYCTSDRGKKFVYERIVDADPKDAHEDEQSVANETELTKRAVKIISVFFCIFAIVALSLTAVLIFQRCVLANTRILPSDPCPDNYPMDCFVFNGTSRSPLSENVTFRCDPLNTTQFPVGLVNASASCFGWIFAYQSTENVLNQLGVCTGLLGLFTAMLALIIFLARSILSIILCSVFIACCVVAFILLLYYQWSLAFLTYAVLILGMLLGVFGIVLYFILRQASKRVGIENITAVNPPQATRSTPSSVASPLSSTQPQTQAPHSKLVSRSAKVTPK